MLILGLDAAQSTGWALYDTRASMSAIRAGVLKAIGASYEEKATTLGDALVKLASGVWSVLLARQRLFCHSRRPHPKPAWMKLRNMLGSCHGCYNHRDQADGNEMTDRDTQQRRAEAMEAAAIQSSFEALRALLLLNGGACVALLGFLATTINAESDTDRARLLAAILSALLYFGTGAGFAVLVASLAYLANHGYSRALVSPLPYQSLSWRAGGLFNNVAIVVAIASLGAFFIGLYKIGLALS